MVVTDFLIRSVLRKNSLSGRPVCLHCSLRSFGTVAGGPLSVIQAFLDERCTLLVPTFSWGYAVPAPQSGRPSRNGCDYGSYPGPTTGIDRVYTTSALEVDADMGAVAAAVVASPGHVRGNHPLNSFSALGPMAQELVAGQAPLDVYAPLGALAQRDGYVLLMGVDLDKMTLLHLAEREAGRTIFRRWANDSQGQPQAVEVGGCSDGFTRLSSVLQPVAQSEVVGSSAWKIFPASETLSRAVTAIQSAPDVTHCDSHACKRCEDSVAGGAVLPVPA